MTPIRQTPARRRPVWKPLAAAGLGGAVLVTTGFGVFAQLQATAFNQDAQQIDTGTLRLTLDKTAPSAGFTTAISKLAPNDVVNRLVTVTNTGTLEGFDLTLGVKDSVGSLLSTDAGRGLQVSVTRCSTGWTYSAVPAPVCTGTQATVLSDRALSSLTGAPVALDNEVLTADTGANSLLVTVRLPEQTEVSRNGGTPTPSAGTGSIQNLTAQLTWTFTEVQRAGTTTSS